MCLRNFNKAIFTDKVRFIQWKNIVTTIRIKNLGFLYPWQLVLYFTCDYRTYFIYFILLPLILINIVIVLIWHMLSRHIYCIILFIICIWRLNSTSVRFFFTSKDPWNVKWINKWTKVLTSATTECSPDLQATFY